MMWRHRNEFFFFFFEIVHLFWSKHNLSIFSKRQAAGKILHFDFLSKRNMLIFSQNLETDKTSENYNLKKMENKIIKDHTIKSDEHEMRVDGQFLKEKKVTTFIDG